MDDTEREESFAAVETECACCCWFFGVGLYLGFGAELQRGLWCYVTVIGVGCSRVTICCRLWCWVILARGILSAFVKGHRSFLGETHTVDTELRYSRGRWERVLKSR